MTFSSIPSPSHLEWKFSQVFGERSPSEIIDNIDVISAVEFDKSGDYLAIGDRGGRVVIFEKKSGRDDLLQNYSRSELEKFDHIEKQPPKFQYKTEFQSHEPEVKEHKVKKVKEVDHNPFVSSENSLLADRSFLDGQHKASFANGYALEQSGKIGNRISVSYVGHTKVSDIDHPAPAKCRKVYAHAHDFNINSISNNSDGETFLSADDLRINLWNLETSDQCFNIIDMKPPNMEDLTEVITSAEFHPFHCNMLAYGSSRGFIRLVDMRQSALCDNNGRILQEAESHGVKSFFTEIIASISDMKFANDGRHILSRDYLNLKLWDTCMETSPVVTYKIHEHLRPKLSDLYNNDAIFDKFDCCFSGDGLHFATGSYSNQLHIYSSGTGSREGVTIEASRNPNKSWKQPLWQQGKPHSRRARRSSLSNLTRGFYRQEQENVSSEHDELSCDLSSKLQHVAWHPANNLIACAAGSSLFMYYA